MHTKVPFLVVFFLSIFQIMVYAVLNYEEFSDITTVNPDQVVEIEISDLSNQVHTTTDPEQMNNIINYFKEFEYQRLLDDQTAYMPRNTMMINVYDGEEHDFIIPYGDEVLVSHKVYQIQNGPLEEEVILDMLNLEHGR